MIGVLDQSVANRRGRDVLPPLDNGDFLRAREFLRRYEAMPELKKAELIEGVVFMASPVRVAHSKPDSLMQVWLGTYALRTPGTESLTNATVQLDPDNVPQPDALLRLSPANGGQTRTNAEGYVTGAPELVAEVAASSASRDARAKLHVYQRAGVKEYLLWRLTERRFDWFVLEDDEYVALTPDAAGLLRSRAFPGLWLEVAALLAMDGPAVLAALERGLASPEHAAWLARAA